MASGEVDGRRPPPHAELGGSPREPKDGLALARQLRGWSSGEQGQVRVGKEEWREGAQTKRRWGWISRGSHGGRSERRGRLAQEGRPAAR